LKLNIEQILVIEYLKNQSLLINLKNVKKQ